MENEKEIKLFNTLLSINNERMEGYGNASQVIVDIDLKKMFEKLCYTSEKCAEELISEVTKIGGSPAEEAMIDGDYFRAWLELDAAIKNNDKIAILNACVYAEEVAKSTYLNVLENGISYFNDIQKSLINTQYIWISTDQNNVKKLKSLKHEPI